MLLLYPEGRTHEWGAVSYQFWSPRAKLKNVALYPPQAPLNYLPWSPSLHLNGATLVMLIYLSIFFPCSYLLSSFSLFSLSFFLSSLFFFLAPFRDPGAPKPSRYTPVDKYNRHFSSFVMLFEVFFKQRGRYRKVKCQPDYNCFKMTLWRKKMYYSCLLNFYLL